MFKTAMKKIGIVALFYVLLNLDVTLLQLLPILTQDGQFSMAEQMGYGLWVLFSLGIFIGVAYAFKLLSLKEIRWGRICLIALLNFAIFYAGNVLGAVVGQLTHNTTMVNQDALNDVFAHVPAYIQLAVAGVIIPIMEEILFRGLLAKVLFGKYVKTGLVVSSILFVLAHSAFTPQTIIIYGVMAAGFAVTYYKTKHIEYSMGAHILNNTVSVLLSFIG